MKHFDVTAEYIRMVISGEIKFRKCPNCDSEGEEWQHYNEDGKPCSGDDPTAYRDTCEKCDGVAYIEIPQ